MLYTETLQRLECFVKGAVKGGRSCSFVNFVASCKTLRTKIEEGGFLQKVTKLTKITNQFFLHNLCVLIYTGGATIVRWRRGMAALAGVGGGVVIACLFLSFLRLTVAAEEAGAPLRARQIHDLGATLFASSREASARGEALKLLKQAAELDPGTPAYRLDLADACMESGEEVLISLAIDLYEELLGAEPKSDAVRARLAHAYARIGNAETALDLAAERMKSSDKLLQAAVLQMAAIALDTRRIDLGIKALEKVLTRFPKDSGTRLLLATLLAEGGNKQRALSLVDNVLRDEAPKTPLSAEAAEIRRRLE